MEEIEVLVAVSTKEVDALSMAKIVLEEHYGYIKLSADLESLYRKLAGAMLKTV